jgi:hypothetical protein
VRAAARSAADATNTPPGSTDRSATSSRLGIASTSSVPHRNNDGASTDSAAPNVSTGSGPVSA